jgi:hypothetical protein
VTHTFNPSTQEAEASRSLSSRLAWPTEQILGQLGLYRQKLSKKEKRREEKRREEKRREEKRREEKRRGEGRGIGEGRRERGREDGSMDDQ